MEQVQTGATVTQTGQIAPENTDNIGNYTVPFSTISLAIIFFLLGYTLCYATSAGIAKSISNNPK